MVRLNLGSELHGIKEEMSKTSEQPFSQMVITLVLASYSHSYQIPRYTFIYGVNLPTLVLLTLLPLWNKQNKQSTPHSPSLPKPPTNMNIGAA